MFKYISNSQMITNTQSNQIRMKVLLSPDSIINFNGALRGKISKILDMCSEQYGYIMSIDDIQIGNHKKIIHSSGKIEVDTIVSITHLLPNIGDHFNSSITDIFQEGIITAYGKMKIFIPAHTLENARIVGNTLSGNTTLKVGDWVQVKVENVKFMRGQYQCIGKLSV